MASSAPPFDATKDTTIILVHGMWHKPIHWDTLIPHLSNNFNISTPSLPSTGAIPASTSADADIKAIRDSITTSIDQNQKVILVLHSYAGIPGTEATKGLLASDLRSQNENENANQTSSRGIIHIVYIASFMPRANDSLFSMTEAPAPWLRMNEEKTTATVDDPTHAFYNDVADTQLIEHAISNLTHQSLAPMMHTVSYPAHKFVATTYIACTADNAVYMYEKIIKKVRDDQPLDLHVVTFEGVGHSPFLSRPEETAQVILGVAK